MRIAFSEPIEMEIQCQIYKSVKNLQSPMTMVTPGPACSAFPSEIKLPLYFRQYPNGFDVALRAANLHIPRFNPSSFSIWNHFNISNLTVAVTRKLQKLPPTSSVPVDQLKAQILGFKDLDEDKNDKSWIYIVGGGSGSGLILLIVVGVIVYWCCKKPQSPDDRPATFVTYSAPESTNLGSPNMDARRAGQYSALGQESVEVHEPVGGQKIVIYNDMQLAYVSALLDHIEDLGTNVQSHHRRLRARHCPALPVDV